MKNLTSEVCSYLFPPDSRIFRDSGIPNSLDILQRTVIVVGDIGSGKSTLAKSLYLEMTKRYPCPCFTTKLLIGRLDTLLDESVLESVFRDPDMKMVKKVILFNDDITLERYNRETLMNYFRVRHLFHKTLGWRKGLIVNLLCSHRLLAVPKELRSHVKVIIFRSTPPPSYDYSYVKRLIGEDALKTLYQWEKSRDKYDRDWNKSLVWYYGESGYIELPPPRGVRLVQEKVNFKYRVSRLDAYDRGEVWFF